MNNKTTIIIIIISTLIITGFVYFLTSQNSQEKETIINCKDTDNGKDYYKLGEITLKINNQEIKEKDSCVIKERIEKNDLKKVESCFNEKCYLLEHFCSKTDSTEYKQIYKCPAGCINGTCREQEIIIKKSRYNST